MLGSILFDTDSYKYTHHVQYPPKTQYVHSYLESRGGQWKETVFFGLQYILQRYLVGQVVTKEGIDQAEALVNLHIGPGVFNRKGWEHILRKHGGKLPVRIRAVAEGSVVPVSNVLMTIENTDPEVPWLTNFLETALMRVWYPCTVGTQSFQFRKLWKYYLEKTGTPEDLLFKLHDFGCRGVSSQETAAIGGLAHLLSFKGTDTVPALVLAQQYYGHKGAAGFSIPASEHSTITSWGREHEYDAYKNMLEQYPTGLVACVSDSYDIYTAVSTIWGQLLKSEVLGRDGTLVIRPDSGDPATVVLDIIRRLDTAFGSTVNAKGYTVLNGKVRVIQGDGIDLQTAELILHKLDQWKISADNLAMGSGGALLQKVNRDTQKFAIKASLAVVDGKPRDVSKSPIADAGKKSKAGRLKLCKRDGAFYTARIEDGGDDMLMTVFENGELKNFQTLEVARAVLSTCEQNPPRLGKWTDKLVWE